MKGDGLTFGFVAFLAVWVTLIAWLGVREARARQAETVAQQAAEGEWSI